MKPTLHIVILLALALGLSAQDGYRIDFTVEGQADQSMLIAHHMGGKQYIIDSLQLDGEGHVVYTGDSALDRGIYLAVFPALGNRYFEFIMGYDQDFSVTTAAPDFFDALVFDGSRSNDLFLRDMRTLGAVRQQVDSLKELRSATSDDEEVERLTAEIRRLNDQVVAGRDRLRTQNPDAFYAKILGLMKEVEIPDPPRDETGAILDSSFQWRYYNAHYFDHVDLSEQGIVRTPIYRGKLMDYFKKTVSPEPDSIIAAVDRVLADATDPDVFQYTITTVFNHYANSKVMGHDAVYAHIANEYYAEGMAPWTDSTTLRKIIQRGKRLAPTLLGEVAPDLTLRDTTVNRTYTLHDVQSPYTILYIWDPECGHCKEETPKLKTFYDTYGQYGIEVFAVSTVNIYEVDKWKAFIRTHDLDWINVADLYNQTDFRKDYDVQSTPITLVLDNDKEIIAKRLGTNQLADFFRKYLRRQGDANYVHFEPVEDSAEMGQEE